MNKEYIAQKRQLLLRNIQQYDSAIMELAFNEEQMTIPR